MFIKVKSFAFHLVLWWVESVTMKWVAALYLQTNSVNMDRFFYCGVQFRFFKKYYFAVSYAHDEIVKMLFPQNKILLKKFIFSC